MKVENIIGMPIVSMCDDTQLGTVKSIVMDQNLKYVKNIQLAPNKFINVDDIVRFGKNAILVEDSQALQKVPDRNRRDVCQPRANGHTEVLSTESSCAYWWLQITNWD